MERAVTLRRRAPMLQRLLLMLLLLLTAASLCSACDVRNDLRGAARKTQHAPVVFAGRVRSRGPERRGLYQVTVEVENIVKGGSLGGGPLRLRFRLPAAASAAGRRNVCVADAAVVPGEKYIVFVKAVGGPRNFTAVSAPEKHNRRNMRKVTRVLRKRRGRSPPRVAKMRNVRLPAGRRLRLLCRVRGAPLPRVTWFKDGEPINATRRIRIRMKKKKRRLQSQLIIRRVLPADSGSYECRARNRVGKDAKRAKVSVGRRRQRPAISPRPTGPDKPRDSWRAADACDIPSYCLNGGSCTLYRSVMEYVCQCAEGFKGKRCERKTVYAIKQRPDSPVLLAAQYQPLMLVLGGLTILLLFVVLVAVLCRRNSRPRSGSKRGNGTVTMATGKASEQPAAATAAAAMNGHQAASAGRSEQVSCCAPVGPGGDRLRGTDVPPPPPSPSRRPSPAGAAGAAEGEGTPGSEPAPSPATEPLLAPASEPKLEVNPKLKPEPTPPRAASVARLEALLSSLAQPDCAGPEAFVHTKDA